MMAPYTVKLRPWTRAEIVKETVSIAVAVPVCALLWWAAVAPIWRWLAG